MLGFAPNSRTFGRIRPSIIPNEVGVRRTDSSLPARERPPRKFVDLLRAGVDHEQVQPDQREAQARHDERR